MKSLNTLCALALLAAGTVACGDDGGDSSNTIVDIAVADGNFETLATALIDTGLDETLSGEGPFTVFAPTDDAFARLPDGTLASLDSQTLSQILTYHVVAGDVRAADVVGLDTATTVESSDIGINVFGDNVLLNGSVQVVTTDIVADNGVIHVVDSVLLPPSIPFPGDLVQAAQAYPVFDTLVGAVVDAELVATLQGDNGGDGYTVFAPTNYAFTDLGVDLGTLTQQELEDTLLYHVVPDTVLASEVVGLNEADAASGDKIDIAVDSGAVRLNDSSNVIRVDLQASNGVIHVIDAVLTP